MKLSLGLSLVLLISPVTSFLTCTNPQGSMFSHVRERAASVLQLSMQRIGSHDSMAANRRPSGSRTLQKEEFALDSPQSTFYVNPFPLKPYNTERKTVAKKVDDNIYTFEQEHGFANVSVNIRMTVVRLNDGGLWVHAPIAPTEECVAMVKKLGEVKYVILPTTGLEHKIFMKPFMSRFPNAKAYVAPGQWSWPIDLPLGFKVEGVLQDMDPNVPWSKEIEQKVVYAEVGIGKTSEVAFFHKKSSTLLVTDAVIFIPPEAPEVLQAYREEENKWKKSALMSCFLGPPYVPSFDVISGKLFVSPVVRTFIYERTPDETRDWIRRICQWKFRKIIPAHLDAPVAAGPAELQEAFKFLDVPTSNPLPEGDMGPLNAISKLLTLSRLVPPRAADLV